MLEPLIQRMKDRMGLMVIVQVGLSTICVVCVDVSSAIIVYSIKNIYAISAIDSCNAVSSVVSVPVLICC